MAESLIRTLSSLQRHPTETGPSLDRLLFVDPDIRFRESMRPHFEGIFSVDFIGSLKDAEKMLSGNIYSAVSTELILPEVMSDSLEIQKVSSEEGMRNGNQVISISRQQGLYVVVLTNVPYLVEKTRAHKLYDKHLIYQSGMMQDYLRSLQKKMKS